MDIDRKLAAELGVSAAAVVVFVGAAYVVSSNYAIPGDADPLVAPSPGMV